MAGSELRGEDRLMNVLKKLIISFSCRNEPRDNGRPEGLWPRRSLRCSLLSLARAVLRILAARQGSSQQGRSPAVAAGGLVPSQTYEDLVECADDTAGKNVRSINQSINQSYFY